ncbi:TPA: VCBS domain-containing protein, partial [Vibrio campbellii]
PSTIKVTINGTNDAATVSSATAAVDETDKAVTASGTLTSTDVDNPDNAFTPDSITGSHGDLTIDAHGHWVFTANSAFNQLNVGDKVEETFTVASVDGTQSTIKVTINGTNDRPTISGTSSGSVIEQGLNTAGTPDATGSLIATDIDKSDTITWAINQPQGQWGTLSIDQHGHWHYQLDSSTGGAADKLAAGEHQSESFWITATDSAGATVPHKIVIDVQGSNDKPIVSASTQLPAGKEDQPVTIKASDLLTHASDVDSGDVLHVTNLQATHGSLTDNKDGTYTFTPDKDFNGEIRLTYDVVDGHGGSVSTQAKFDLTASPDNAIITDAQTNADLRGVTEDRGYIDTHYQLHYDGKLNIQDPDAGEAQFDPNIGPQTYKGIGYDTKLGGHILLMRDGHYTYTLDNRNIQNLAQGEVKHDSAVIRSADGTTHTIELTVHGTNDAPVINAQSHSVTEDGQLLTGQMQGHDIDHGATLTYSIAQAVDGLTFNPDGSYSFDPSHPSYQSLVQGQTQTLTVPVTVTDEHGASATQNLEIMVTGSNDGAQISGTDTGDVYESTYTDRSPDYQRGNISHLWNDHIHTSGKLDIFDSDAGEAHFDNNAPAYQYFGQYGRLILQPDGNWYYRVDVGDSAIGRKIDALNTGENLTDTITIRSADGTTHDVVITIHGDNDSPFASGEVQLNSGKEDNAQTITEAQLLANSMDVDTSDAGKLHVDNLQVDHGSIRDNQDGTYTFTPQKDYNGRVHFTYDVKDAHSGVTHTGATMHLAPVGDAATISGTDSGSITEDRHVFPDSMHHIQVTGSLSISDPDAGEDHFRASGAFGHEKAISDPFQGEMHIDRYGNWDYVLANGNPALQALKQGETKDVIYEVRSADGTPHRITITVTGTNDAPTLTAQTHNVTEDGQRLSGQMLGHDIDHGAVLTYSISHPIDGLTFHSDGSYSFNSSHSSYQHLADGQQQTVTVPITVTDEHGDSATELLVFTVTGTNDAPVVSPITDSVTEDSDKHHQLDLLQGAKDVEGDGLSIGQIQCTYHGQTGALPAGVRFAPDGHTLVVDATDSNFQHLAAGEKETIVFHYQVIDSHGAATAQTATITVVGTDDKAQLVTSNIDLTEGEALKTYQHISDVSGHLSLTDPDSHDSTHFEFNIVQGSQNVGVLTIWPDGQYRYYVDPARNHNAHYAVNSLKSGETLTEHFQVKTSDGQTKDIAVTIHGEDNQAHLQVVDPKLLPVDPDLYEDKTSFSDPNKLYAGGIVRVHDPDHDEAQAVAHTETSAHGGHFQVGSSGGWSYTIDNNSPQVQNLGAGESFTDSFTIRSKDGSASQVISVTVHGTNDNPIVTSQVQLPSSTEDHTSTITVAQLLANSRDIDNNDAGQLNIANLIADHGSIRDNQDGTYTFTPEKDYNGEVHFTYDVKDAHSGVTHTGATMHLAPVGDAATITGTDTGSITEDRHVFPDSMHHIQVTGSLSVSDPDDGEDHFRASGAFGHERAISDPFQGEMHIDRYGNWDYVLANGNPALQALKQGETKDVIYEVHSADGTPHRITITVTGTNDAPTVSSSVTLAAGKEDTAVTLQASDLLAHASDIDHNAQLSIHNLSADHGQIVDNHDGTFRFIPDKDYNGPVQFSYQVQDEHGASVAQTASMNLVAVNDVATISGDSSASVTEGGSQGVMPDLTITKGAWLANIGSGFDFPPVTKNDPNAGRWYSVGGDEGPAGGAAQGMHLSAGFWVMNMGDPNYGVNGYAVFTRGTNSATAHFNGVTDDAHGDLHITDPDVIPDTFVNVQNQIGDHGYGTFTMKDGHWSFVAGDKATSLPDGAKAQETFTFRTHDGVTHQVTINLTGTDTPSEFKGDFSGNLREGNVGDIAAVHGSISITDPDTNQTPTLPDMPSTSGDNGYGYFTMHNGHWEYTLDQSKVQHVGAKETVQDKITITASDGTKHDIVVTIQGTNDAPVVNGQTFITPQNGNTPIALSDLLANVRDPDTHDNQHLSVSHLQADHGTITPDGHGGYLYHPENGYNGPVDISYQVTDPEGASVSVHASMGSAPTASSGVIQMNEDTPHTFTTAEFSADNFDQLTISSLPDATHGTLTFNGQPVAVGQHIDTAHIDQLVFTPSQNYHGDASFGFTVSENGIQSAAASGHIAVDSVTDAASISMHLSATESTMQTGQGHGLAVGHLDGRHLSNGNGQTSITAEIVVQMQSGSNNNPDAVVLQFGRAAAKGTMLANPIALEEQLGDGSYSGTHHGFTITNPHNLTLWMPGHMPIQTGIDMTADSGSHRYTFTVDTAKHSATVFEDGKEAFHTDSASVWHWIADLQGAYTRSGEWAGDDTVLGGENFWLDSTPRNPNIQHYPKWIAERVGNNGLSLGDGLHPLGNDKHEIMGSDGQMHAAGGDLSIDAKFSSAVIVQGSVTAGQVAAGPLNAQTPGLGDDKVLLDLGVQGGQIVDHTGHQSNALGHFSLNSPLIGGDPLHHDLNLDVQATDPDDHVTSVKLTGLPDGAMLDDGHGHTATVHNGQAIDVQDWNRASIGVVLPNTAPTGDVHLHVEVTTTGPDGTTATSTADNTSMHVSDVMTDTAPDIIQSIMLGDEDQTYHFSEQDFGYSDKDGDPLDHVTITQLPDPAHGQLLINGHAVTAGQEISVYDIGKLIFQPAKDFNGDVDFQYSVSDGLKDSAPSQGTLTIAPVVDVTIKLSPTSDLGSSNTDNLTNDATPTITGHTDIPYCQVTIYDGSKPVGHAVSDASGQYSVVVNNLTDGNHNLSAKALTPSSGISATSSLLSVHIDTQIHVGIQMDPITADSVINAQESNSSINITGSVSGDFSIGDIVTLDVNGAQHTGTVDAKGHYSIAVPGSELIADADQQIEASIAVTDSAGNSVHAVTNAAYQVDTQVNLPTITFESPGPDGLYSKAEIAHGHPNTVTATITPPGDAKIGEHLVVNGQDHVLDAHTLQHGLQIEVSPGSQVQVTMTDEHGNTAGSQGVAASAIPEPIVVKPPSGSHQVSGTLGVPPLIPSQTPVPSAQNGWRIHLPNGQYVTSHHGQYGTLTIDPQTGHIHYQEQAQAHTGPHGSASGIGQHEDKFEISLQGANQDEVVAHVNVQILSHGPGHSGKLTIGTEVVDMTITPIVHATHPAPPPVQHDEPEIASHEGFTFTVSEDASLDLSQHAHQEPDQKTDHHGAAAYLDALGIQPNASPTMEHAQPADMDIVLAQVDQQHVVDYDQAHLDMSDVLEHHDAANNQDDEHHHHNDVDGLPDIDPNN